MYVRSVLFWTATLVCSAGAQEIAGFEVDPISRNINIVYSVPADAPDPVTIVCSWSPPDKNEWKPADVMPLVSETAYNMTTSEQWNRWHTEGHILERRAAGLNRTAVFNPYPEAVVDGQIHVDFRVELRGPNDEALGAAQARIDVDNRNVRYIEDWSQVVQADRVTGDEAKWSFRTDVEVADGVTHNNALIGNLGAEQELPPLTYPLDLKGHYAIFLLIFPESR